MCSLEIGSFSLDVHENVLHTYTVPLNMERQFISMNAIKCVYYHRVKEKAESLVSIVPPAKCSIIYLCKHDVNERVRGKHKQISVRFVMTFAQCCSFCASSSSSCSSGYSSLVQFFPPFTRTILCPFYLFRSISLLFFAQ